MKICGIYKISNLVNGKIYIGQSVDVYDRIAHHKAELRNNRHSNKYLQYSWNKYGEENFSFEIIESCKRNELNNREQYWISYYDSYNNGYNHTLGGDGGQIFTPVLQFDNRGNYLNEYQNGIVAGEETGINCNSIYACCNLRLLKAGGYIWLYKSNYNGKESLDLYLRSTRLCPVNQYDFNGNLIKQWDSCSEIVNKLNINPIQALNHSAKSYHGYVWRYINDLDDLSDDYFLDVRNTSAQLKLKPVLQFSLDNILVKEYKSSREVAKDGHGISMVKKHCKDGKAYHGFYWKFKND